MYPFDAEKYKPQIVSVVNGATVYDHPNGVSHLLMFQQCLSLPKLRPSLICPNQLQENKIIVDDVPKHLSPDGKSEHHISVEEMELKMPLELRGVISYLPMRYPTVEDLRMCEQVYMTSSDEWDPYSNDFERQEKAAGEEHPSRASHEICAAFTRRSEMSVVLTEVTNTLDDNWLVEGLKHARHVPPSAYTKGSCP